MIIFLALIIIIFLCVLYFVIPMMRKKQFLKMAHSLHQKQMEKMRKTGMKDEDMPKKYDIERAYDKTIKIVSDPGAFSKEPKPIEDLPKNQEKFMREFGKQLEKIVKIRNITKRSFSALFIKYSQTNAKKYEVEKAYVETINNIPNPGGFTKKNLLTRNFDEKQKMFINIFNKKLKMIINLRSKLKRDFIKIALESWNEQLKKHLNILKNDIKKKKKKDATNPGICANIGES